MSTTSPPRTARGNDAELVEALRASDEAVFVDLIRHHAVLLRVALTYVSTRVVAEEVVQETWLGVLNGLARFQGRSSLRTWIFQIASDIARTRAVRESRYRPFSSLAQSELERCEPSVDAERFCGPDHARFPGRWARGPAAWATEERLLARETREVVRVAIEQLPPAQRLVVTLRDVEGWSAEQICQALELTGCDQRVLLHRARSRVRAALERYLAPEGPRPTAARSAVLVRQGRRRRLARRHAALSPRPAPISC